MGGGDIRRFRRHAVKEVVKRFLGDCSRGDEVVSEASSTFGLKIERPGYILHGDQLCLDQQIT
jgi:hypothetical protein